MIDIENTTDQKWVAPEKDSLYPTAAELELNPHSFPPCWRTDIQKNQCQDPVPGITDIPNMEEAFGAHRKWEAS